MQSLTHTRKIDALSLIAMFAVLLAVAGVADAGGTATTIFDNLATATDDAVYGSLGRIVIGLASVGGAIFAIIKGAWLFAGLGIVVAGLMVGAQLVANSSGFSALI